MRRYFTGRSKGGGRVKAFFMFILGILVLQLAAPQKKVNEKEVKKRLQSGIRDWLLHNLDILILVAVHIQERGKTREDSALQKTEEHLLDALGKLANATEEKDILLTAQEVVQEYKNAGYVSGKEDPPGVYSSSMSDEYELVGIINEGDQIRILEKPTYKDGTLAKLGKITRRRS